jgi:hypothetical protein
MENNVQKWVIVYKNNKTKIFNYYFWANLYCILRLWKGIDHLACYYINFSKTLDRKE